MSGGPAPGRRDPGVLVLALNPQGRVEDSATLDRIKRNLADATDCFIFCPGWLHNMADSCHEAARFFLTLDGALTPLRDRVVPARIALHWPSTPFGDSGAPRGAMDGTLWPELERKMVGQSRDRRVSLLPVLADLCAVEVPRGPEEELELEHILQSVPDTEGREGASRGTFDALSFWVMKRRAGDVGERFGRECLAPLWERLPCAGRPRLHLVGHSFGAKLLTSAVLGGVRPQSLTLLLAAFSAFAFAPDVPGFDQPGFYHRVLEEGQVRGPIVVLRSTHDRALEFPYRALAASGRPGRGQETGKDGGDRLRRRAGRRLRMSEIVIASAIGAVGARGVGAPEVDLLEVQMIGLPRQPIINVDGSRVVTAGDARLGAHRDIHRAEIATLILLAARLLQGGPDGARSRRVSVFDPA